MVITLTGLFSLNDNIDIVLSNEQEHIKFLSVFENWQPDVGDWNILLYDLTF